MADQRDFDSLVNTFLKSVDDLVRELARQNDGQVIDYPLLEAEVRDGSNRLVPVIMEPRPFEEQVRHDFADLLVQDEYFPETNRFSTPVREYLRYTEADIVWDENWLISVFTLIIIAAMQLFLLAFVLTTVSYSI